jgi:hypothetical protein
MDYEKTKAELEARFKPASAARRLESWLLENPDMAPKAEKKVEKKVEKVVKEEAKEE